MEVKSYIDDFHFHLLGGMILYQFNNDVSSFN